MHRIESFKETILVAGCEKEGIMIRDLHVEVAVLDWKRHFHKKRNEIDELKAMRR